MDDLLFQAPVAISVGAGFKREIVTLSQMQNFLKEWSPARHGPVYETAVSACNAARAGLLSADQARRAFVSFAEAAGITWTGVDPVTALRQARSARGIRAKAS